MMKLEKINSSVFKLGYNYIVAEKGVEQILSSYVGKELTMKDINKIVSEVTKY